MVFGRLRRSIDAMRILRADHEHQTTAFVGPRPGADVSIPAQRPVGVGEGERFIADRAAARLMRSSAQQLGRAVPAWVHELADATAQHQATVQSTGSDPSGGTERMNLARAMHGQMSDDVRQTIQEASDLQRGQHRYSLWQPGTLDVWENWPPVDDGVGNEDLTILQTSKRMQAEMQKLDGGPVEPALAWTCAENYVIWQRERTPRALATLKTIVRHVQARDVIDTHLPFTEPFSQARVAKALAMVGLQAEEMERLPDDLVKAIAETYVVWRESTGPERDVLTFEMERIVTVANRATAMMVRHTHVAPTTGPEGITLDLDLTGERETSRRGSGE